MNLLQQKEIVEIFSQYQNVIRPMVVSLEVDDVEYPIEIFNEIRAIMNHLAACTYWDVSNDPDAEAKTDKDLNNARSHLKRAIYDCYKYSCVSADDYYKKFLYRLRYIDLSVIDNGEFSVKLSAYYSEALEALRDAKLAEHDITKRNSNEPFELFQIAYQKYHAVREFIHNSKSKVEKARRKQIGQGTFSMTIAVVGFILTAIGTILTIVNG